MVITCLTCLVLAFSACKKESAVTISNEKQLIQTAYADETNTGNGFTFTATDDWTLTVKKDTPTKNNNVSWMKLLCNSVETYSGCAGTYIIVTSLEINYTGSTRSASIEIASGDDKITISVTQQATTKDGDFPEEKGVVINGIKWATRNVDMPGTFATKPEDAGMFYQWNRKIGWSSTDPMVNSNGSTTWDDSNPEGYIWEKANDPCPEGWRVPTIEELRSLADTDNEWTTLNMVDGRIYGSGDNILFLPAAGFRFGNGPCVDVETGYYWSCTIVPEHPFYFTYCYDLVFWIHAGDAGNSIHYRTAGHSVRCVTE